MSTGLLFASPQLAPDGPAEIAEFIQVDMDADQAMAGAEIVVKIEDQIAILTGTAESLAQSERAAARAIACVGVRAVINRVMVTSGSPTKISELVGIKLRDQKMVSANKVVHSVSESRVLLQGEIGTWDEKELVRELVSEVPGVVAIDNELEVTFEGVRRDSQIEEQLRFQIQDDPLYAGLDLRVSVNSGTVRLGGEVGSRGEYDRLIRRSYVTGVMDVQIDGLSINPHLVMEGLGDKVFSDTDATTALTDALEMDPRIDAGAIRAKMDEGEVRLTGRVATLEERDAVEATARWIPGIMKVSNQLTVTGGIARVDHGQKLASPPTLKSRR